MGFGRDIAEVLDRGGAFRHVLSATTAVPADAVGRPDLGRLAPGAHADIVWWNDDAQPARTWVDVTQGYDLYAARAWAAVATKSLG